MIEIPAHAGRSSPPHFGDEKIGRRLERIREQEACFHRAYEPVSSFFGQSLQPEVMVGRPLATSMREASS